MTTSGPRQCLEGGSRADAVASGAVYGRSRAERWMWPAHRAGDRLAIDPAERCEAGAEQCSAGAAQSLVLETLSVSPRVFRVPSLLSASEVAELTRRTVGALDRGPALGGIGEGPTMKRYKPKARGSAGRINKRTSHVTIILSDGK